MTSPSPHRSEPPAGAGLPNRPHAGRSPAYRAAVQGDGFAADPARLREAAGIVAAHGARVATATRAPLRDAASGSGPRVAAALAELERDLGARAGACAEALQRDVLATAHRAGALHPHDGRLLGDAFTDVSLGATERRIVDLLDGRRH